MLLRTKRFILFIALAAVIIGARFVFNGVLGGVEGGEYGYFTATDVEVSAPRPLFNRQGAYERIDTAGDRAAAENVLKRLCARTVAEENIDGIEVIYAYSPHIVAHAAVGGERVNVMIALSDGKMTVGSPLIKGSY